MFDLYSIDNQSIGLYRVNCEVNYFEDESIELLHPNNFDKSIC